MYKAGGGAAVYRTSPLQRTFRDAFVATQHAMVRPRTFETYGRLRLGLRNRCKAPVEPLADERDPAELRQLLRSWLADNASPTPRQLAEAGLVAPHWPRPWGLDADPHLQLVIADELATAGVSLPENQIGIGWAGPTILTGGTEEQHRRWLPGILDGSQTWTQLFSEPDAGSDLASLRTSAVRDGDHYVVDGQKIWSTWANHAQWGILLARTDATVPRHRGISYFIVDMSSPGVEVRKVIEMTGGNHFNETFLNEVRIPVENRIGDEGDGWRLASVTLGNERVSLSEGGVLWGMGPTSSRSACRRDAPPRRRRGPGHPAAVGKGLQRRLRQRAPHPQDRRSRDERRGSVTVRIDPQGEDRCECPPCSS